MGAKFNIYIDESGDTGIKKIAKNEEPGSSPYFVLGAVVLQPTAEVHARNMLSDFRETIGKKAWKHATQLGHSEKVLFAREMGRLPARYFALVSNKETLSGYREFIDFSPHKFYNKCVKYLLESICSYLAQYEPSQSDIGVCLEQRNHDYSAMIAYLDKVKNKPLHEKSKSLRLLNPFSITTRQKGEEDILELADFVAHAVYQCTNRSRSNYGIPEPRYFTEISSRFAGCSRGKPLGHGIKCLHKIEDLFLEPDVEKIWRNVRVQLPSKRQTDTR